MALKAAPAALAERARLQEKATARAAERVMISTAGGEGWRCGRCCGSSEEGASAEGHEVGDRRRARLQARQGWRGEQKPAAAKPAEKKPAAAAGTETDTHHANGKPKKNEKGEDLDAEGKVVKAAAPKVKTAAELDLKPDQLKLLKPETQARFREVIGALKEREGTIATLTDTNKTLTEARDAILGVMEETNTTQEQLAYYLEFNALLKSSDPKDLEQALGMVEQQRLALYKALGKEPEGGGIDLLADFPDLKKQVDEEEITRAAALEIANAAATRRARSAGTRAARAAASASSATQTAEQQKKAARTALTAIETWTAGSRRATLTTKRKKINCSRRWRGVEKLPAASLAPDPEAAVRRDRGPESASGTRRPQDRCDRAARSPATRNRATCSKPSTRASGTQQQRRAEARVRLASGMAVSGFASAD
jgi:hypothetical protein